jgi:hypothetical protein
MGRRLAMGCNPTMPVRTAMRRRRQFSEDYSAENRRLNFMRTDKKKPATDVF